MNAVLNDVPVGFEFYLAFSQINGVTLYDVRFKGERIIYEVRLLQHSSSQALALTHI